MLKIATLITTIIFSTILCADTGEGKELFDEANCQACHENSSFSPKKNKVSDFDKLHKQVQRCEFANSTGWFDDEVIDVAKYLNSKFYHFKAKK